MTFRGSAVARISPRVRRLDPERSALWLEEIVSRWFPTTASKLALALLLIALAAIIMPG